MRRTYWAAGLVIVLAVGLLGVRAFLAPAAGNAQSPGEYPGYVPPATGDTPATDLAISQVILYSNGVGYFQREGLVQDNARVDLTFPVQNINDLLKSMVLQDLGHGHISAVSYDSHDPIDKTLKSFAVNLTNNPSFGQILNQGRGEKIEVHSADQGVLTGTLVGVESRLGAGKDSAIVETLNLLCDDGMRGVRLDHVKRVRFLNAKMDAEMRRALEVLASARDAQKKTVSLKFTGTGQRKVKVGYVVEQPVWRTSYRLLVNKDGKLFVQGWAIVENTSNEDWKDVKLSLVSGRPISFQIDLYQPLYLTRPTVRPEQIASIQPQTHGSAVQNANTFIKQLDEGPSSACAAPAPSLKGLVTGLTPSGGFPRTINGDPGMDPRVDLALTNGSSVTATGIVTSNIQRRNAGQTANNQQLNLQNGVVAAASTSDLGDFFQYVIDQPVTVARQKSAMIPIVNKPIKGTKLSVYNPATHPKYPLLAVELKNDTGLHLMQGPVTVFEGSSYAGDAQLLDLQRGEKRLISYAIDLGTEVEQVVKKSPQVRVWIKLKDGKGIMKSRAEETTNYTARNRTDHDRLVLIEHLCRGGYKLTGKVPVRERTDSVCRFELRVPAGKTAKLEVVEEKEEVSEASTVTIGNPNDQQDLRTFQDEVRAYLRCPCTSKKLVAALKKSLQYAEKLAALQDEIGHEQQELQKIVEDQQRLRANLKEMPQSSAAYKRYLAKFDSQETEIEKLQEHVKARQNTEQQQRREIESFFNNLEVEGEITVPAELLDGSPSETANSPRPALAPPPTAAPTSY